MKSKNYYNGGRCSVYYSGGQRKVKKSHKSTNCNSKSSKLLLNTSVTTWLCHTLTDQGKDVNKRVKHQT